MPPKKTIEMRTSPPSGWEPEGLVTTNALWMAYNAARDRCSRLANGEPVEKKPLEYETTAFWEDLYHHTLLKGYSNHSQQPPNATSEKRCDIVTRYFDGNKRRQTLIFTEAKRSSQAFDTDGIKKMEAQVLGYCQDYLSAAGSNDSVFACAVVGPYIRCFNVRKSVKRLEGLWDGKLGDFKSYLDPGRGEDAAIIQQTFEDMKRSRAPPSPDSASGGFHSSPPLVGSYRAPSSSPEQRLPLLTRNVVQSIERDTPGRDRSISARSQSPKAEPGPSYRQRSPPQGSTARQTPVASSLVPFQAEALVESWGSDTDTTKFLVRPRPFVRSGSEFRHEVVRDERGRDRDTYLTSHNGLRFYVPSLDLDRRSENGAKEKRPKWVEKRQG